MPFFKTVKTETSAPPETTPYAKGEWVYLSLVVAVAAILCGLMLNASLTVVNLDSAIFYLLGQSLSQGHGYLLLSEPNPQPYFTFPPLVPLEIAGLLTLFGHPSGQTAQWIIKGYIHLLFLLSLPAFYGLVRPISGRWAAVVLVALVACNPLMYKYSADILSDVPYWATSCGCLFFAARYGRATDIRQQRWSFVLMLGFLGASLLTRQMGIALGLALCLGMLFNRQWRPLLATALTFGFLVLGWQGFEHVYRLNHQKEADGLNQAGVQQVLDKSPLKLEFIKHFLVKNPVSDDESQVISLTSDPGGLLHDATLRLERYSNWVIDQVIPPLSVRMGEDKHNLAHTLPVQVLLWVLLMLGLRVLGQRFQPVAVYVLIYGAVLLVYPYASPRFLLPMVPLLFWALWEGGKALPGVIAPFAQWLEKNTAASTRWKWAGAMGLLVLVMVAQLTQTVRWVNAGLKLKKAGSIPSVRTENKGYYETLLWVKANTPQDSLVVSRKPPVTYYYSGRPSVVFPFSASTTRVLSAIDQKAARYHQRFPHVYVVEDTAFGETVSYLTPALKAGADRFKLRYTHPASGARVWEWLPPLKP